MPPTGVGSSKYHSIRDPVRFAQLAWAAALFEGEGTVGVHKHSSGGRSFRAQIASTDLDVLEHFAEIVGMGSRRGPDIKPGRKPVWYWQLSNYGQLVELFDMFRPWLCDRRREQFEIALACPPGKRSRWHRFHPPGQMQLPRA
jgi:hypothetical protein